MKNRLIALLLALSMLLSFTACGGGKPAEEPESEIPEIEASSGEEIAEPSEEEPSESEAPSESESDSYSEAMPSGAPGSFLDKILQYHSKNSDTVGWLYIPGTEIDESVVQSYDNDYYLRRTNLKEADNYGCYFADYECNFDNGNLPKNTIIYGHSMELNDDPNGARFSQLKRWLDKDFAESHPYIYFSTPEKDYVYQIFSVMYTSTKFNYIDPEPNGNEFLNVVNEARLASQFNYPVEVDAGDSIISLSTCVYKFTKNHPNKFRFVVMGRLVEPGDEMPETVSIEVNPNPKKPLL